MSSSPLLLPLSSSSSSSRYSQLNNLRTFVSSPAATNCLPLSSNYDHGHGSLLSPICPLSKRRDDFRNNNHPTTYRIRTNKEAAAAAASASVQVEEYDDDGAAVYNKTLRLVECSMFAAVAGLAYFLSNSLSIENYFGCFFSLPIVISSMRWDLAAGRKTMVATAMLLLTLSGPVKALTYLGGSELGSFYSVLHICIACSLSSGSSYGCSGIRSCILVLNKRKHTCSDHHQRSCFSHLLAHRNWCKYHSINELDICYIWDSGYAKLCILCIDAAHSLCFVLCEAWDEVIFDIAKMA